MTAFHHWKNHNTIFIGRRWALHRDDVAARPFRGAFADDMAVAIGVAPEDIAGVTGLRAQFAGNYAPTRAQDAIRFILVVRPLRDVIAFNRLSCPAWHAKCKEDESDEV